MADRSVTLVAAAEVAIGGRLTLPPGCYRAVKRRIQGPTSKQQFTDPEYLIELSGRQIVAMGGTPGAAGLISAEVDVTQQVREGLLKFSDRSPAPLGRRAFAEYRPKGTSLGTAEFRKRDVQKLAGHTWKRVKPDLAERFRKAVREFKVAALSLSPSSLAMKSRPLRSEKTLFNFVKHLRDFAVPSVVGKLPQFFLSPTARRLWGSASWGAPQLHILVRLRTMRLLAMRRFGSSTDLLCRRRTGPHFRAALRPLGHRSWSHGYRSWFTSPGQPGELLRNPDREELRIVAADQATGQRQDDRSALTSLGADEFILAHKRPPYSS
jgi:hypothetical protein